MSEKAKTAGNCPIFKWDEKRRRAAQFVASAELTEVEISKLLDVSERTLRNWKTHPDFINAVKEIVERTKAHLLGAGIRDKRRRLAAYEERWEKLNRVIEGRAEKYKDYDGGASTGLLARQVKVIGAGKDAREVEEFTFDAALVREMRELEKQTAIEMGEWEAAEVQVNNYVTFTGEERKARVLELLRKSV